jgi:hypothetical protein
MNTGKTNRVALFLVIFAWSTILFAQNGDSGVVVLKCSWEKERIRPRPSLASLASQDELVQQSQREQQLAAAKNVGDRGKVAKLESQISNHKAATAKASQTELPRDGYRYKVKVRNDGSMTIKSVDWDYLFVDPDSAEEVMRHQFTSDETIKPGSTKELSVLYFVPPVKTTSVRMLSKKDSEAFTQQAVIMRVVFADGRVWSRP